MQKNYFFTALITALTFAQKIDAQCIMASGCQPAGCAVRNNDPLFWNTNDWWDPVTERHDLAEAEIEIAITLTEVCGGAPDPISYLLMLDTDADGLQETQISSDDLPASGTVNFGNMQLAGVPREFDHRPVPAMNKYRFALETALNGNVRTGRVAWNTDPQPGVFVAPQLPIGVHKIRWTSGGTTVCEYEFEIEDCKKPVVVALNGLSANLMPTHLIHLWASDFLQYAEDNVTPANFIQIGIRKKGTGTGFPEDANGDPLTSVVYDCSELGENFIELWARDKNGNADYAETYVLIQDFNNNCGNMGSSDLTVCVCNSVGQCLEDLQIQLDCNALGMPPLIAFIESVGGCFNLNSAAIIPTGANCTITPVNDTDPLNGVSTYDMVLISKHILGVDALNSPYKYIAADVNKSGSITTFDLVTLRKLILGIHSEFPNNTSWRFVRDDYVFPTNPLAATIPESAPLNNVQSLDSLNFIPVKVGDVNNNAILNFGDSGDDRAPATLVFDNQNLQAGETALVPVGFGKFGQLEGFQFALGFDPALVLIEEVIPVSNVEIGHENFYLSRPGLLNASFASGKGMQLASGEALFFLKIKALRDVKLSEVLILNDERLRPEAYFADGGPVKLDLQFREKSAPASGYQLSALQPNPARDAAFFDLKMPDGGQVRLEIFDAAGQNCLGQTIELPAGFSRLQVPVANLKNAGLYFYRVSVGGEVWSGRFVKN